MRCEPPPRFAVGRFGEFASDCAANRTFPAAVAELESIFGELLNGGPLPVRIMPLLGAAFLIVFDVALAIGLRGTKMCQGRFKIGGS